MPTAFLLNPFFSKYDILEEGIVTRYLFNAMVQAYKIAPVTKDTAPFIFSLKDTAWGLYNDYGLTNNKLENATDPVAVKAQQIILILAYIATTLVQVINADFIMVNANGPVVNEGFSTIIGIAATMGKRILYWKDDARRLWGFNDNPLTIGSMPSITDHILMYSSPSDRGLTIRLNEFDPSQPNNCGVNVLTENLVKLLDQPAPPVVYSENIGNLIKIGAAIFKYYNDNNQGIYWVLATDQVKYQTIKIVLKQLLDPSVPGGNPNLISQSDYAIISKYIGITQPVPPPMSISHNLMTLQNTNLIKSSGYSVPCTQNCMEFPNKIPKSSLEILYKISRGQK